MMTRLLTSNGWNAGIAAAARSAGASDMKAKTTAKGRNMRDLILRI
jgi:hypothetical protein